MTHHPWQSLSHCSPKHPVRCCREMNLLEQVRELIESLNDNDREMLTLRHAEGLTNSEIAEAFDIEPMTAAQTIRSRVCVDLLKRQRQPGWKQIMSWGDDHDDRTQRLAATERTFWGRWSTSSLSPVAEGETPDISDYLRRYPEIADQLKVVIPAMLATEQAALDRNPRHPRPPSRRKTAGGFPHLATDWPRWDGDRLRGGAGLHEAASRVEGAAAGGACG